MYKGSLFSTSLPTFVVCQLFNILKKNNYLFIFGYAGSSLLHVGFSLVEANRGQSAVAMQGLLIAVASLIVENRLQSTQASVLAVYGLNSCGS